MCTNINEEFHLILKEPSEHTILTERSTQANSALDLSIMTIHSSENDSQTTPADTHDIKQAVNDEINIDPIETKLDSEDTLLTTECSQTPTCETADKIE